MTIGFAFHHDQTTEGFGIAEIQDLEHPQCVPTQLDALTILDSCDEAEVNETVRPLKTVEHQCPSKKSKPFTIGVIHPATGKYFEVPVSSDMCVVQLLDLLSPPVAPNVLCVAEINGKQIDLHHLVTGLDLSSTVRFRHYCLPGGAPPVADSLKTELVARGVSPEQIQNRVNAALTTVGTKPIEDAFLTNNP